MMGDILTAVKAKPPLPLPGRMSLRSSASSTKSLRDKAEKAGTDVGHKQQECGSAYAPWPIIVKLLLVKDRAKNGFLMWFYLT